MNLSEPPKASAPPGTPEPQAAPPELFFLDSLRAETAALRVVVFGILREVDDERRESIKEVLNYALSVARERGQGGAPDTAYMRSLEEKLQQISKLISVGSSEGSEDSPRG